jgi:hypothetical protein
VLRGLFYEEAFLCCIIPDVALTTRRADDALDGYQPLELRAGVLAGASNLRSEHVGSDGGETLPLTQIGRQSTL